MTIPPFYDDKLAGELYLTRNQMVFGEAVEFAKANGIKPASQDKEKIAVLGIDCQGDFCLPDGALFVPGAVEDTQRVSRWILENLPAITTLAFTMDTHFAYQIFHPTYWLDEDGNHPDPLTPITYDDVVKGKWKPVSHPRETLEYCKKLEQGGRYVLTVWPLHTMLGGTGHALVPLMHEVALFHATARKSRTRYETKGTHEMTENYSVFSPEVTELGGRTIALYNNQFLDLLMEHDKVFVHGQAKSHCLRFSVSDMLTQIAKRPGGNDLMQRIYLIEDGTSPVPAPPINPLPDFLDFPAMADKAFDEFKALGVNIVTTKNTKLL